MSGVAACFAAAEIADHGRHEVRGDGTVFCQALGVAQAVQLPRVPELTWGRAAAPGAGSEPVLAWLASRPGLGSRPALVDDPAPPSWVDDPAAKSGRRGLCGRPAPGWQRPP